MLIPKEPWIETFTGKLVPIMSISEDDIDIEDIAQSLANTCRFSGHTSRLYSVAQHSILVMRSCAMSISGCGDKVAPTCLAALLDDAAEAYIGDITRPVKELFPKIVELEKVIKGKITKKYLYGKNVDWELIKEADDAALAVEASYLMVSSGKDYGLVVRQSMLDTVSKEFHMLPDRLRAKNIFLDEFVILQDIIS